MFDIGLWEVIVIGIIGLLVIGPDKLPGVASTLGRWVGRTRAYIQTVKNDIDSELRAQELHEMMQPKERDDLYEFIEDTKRELGGEFSADKAAGEQARKPFQPPVSKDQAPTSKEPS